MRARIVIAIGLVAAIALGVWLWKGRDHEHMTSLPATTQATGSAPATASTSEPPPPSKKVRKLTPEQRKELERRIDAARSARSASSSSGNTGSAPALPNHELNVEDLSVHVLDGLKGAIPFLAECYQLAGSGADRRAAAQMTLKGDLSVGTVIDADTITDANKRPLPAELDQCLRATIESLQLPPLEEGDTVKVEFTFDLDDDAAGSGSDH